MNVLVEMSSQTGWRLEATTTFGVLSVALRLCPRLFLRVQTALELKDGAANNANGREVLVLYDLLETRFRARFEKRMAERFQARRFQILCMKNIHLVFKSLQAEGFLEVISKPLMSDSELKNVSVSRVLK